MMNRKRSAGKIAVLLAMSLFFIGCAKTFLVSKDCKTYFFGGTDRTLFNMLCTSGDLQKVLADSGLPEATRAGLYEAQCEDRSRGKLDVIYVSLSHDQQDASKSAFRKRGYEINVKETPNYHVYPYYDNVNFCLPEQY
jgi:hypothetical protein